MSRRYSDSNRITSLRLYCNPHASLFKGTGSVGTLAHIRPESVTSCQSNQQSTGTNNLCVYACAFTQQLEIDRGKPCFLTDNGPAMNSPQASPLTPTKTHWPLSILIGGRSCAARQRFSLLSLRISYLCMRSCGHDILMGKFRCKKLPIIDAHIHYMLANHAT